MRKALKIKGDIYRINPELAAKVTERALKLFRGGKSWTQGGWVEGPLDHLNSGSPVTSSKGNYANIKEAFNKLHVSARREVCFCAEGAVGLAAAELIPGFDRHSTQGRKTVKGIIAALGENAPAKAVEANGPVIMEINDNTDWPTVRKAFKNTIKFFNQFVK